MNFEIGDLIVYTPNIDKLAPPLTRSPDWGIVIKLKPDYIVMKFNDSDAIYHILPQAITHHPHSPKYIKQQLRQCFPEFKEALECREARQVMLQKIPLSVRLPGPAHIVQAFITNVRRHKTKISYLTR
jgi:hypothetical protein